MPARGQNVRGASAIWAKTVPVHLPQQYMAYACVALLVMAAVCYKMGWSQGHNHATKEGWLWQIPGYEYLYAQKVVNWDYARTTESLPGFVSGASSLVATAAKAAITGEADDLTSLLYRLAVPATVTTGLAHIAARHRRPRAIT